MLAWCKQGIAGFKVPRRIIAVEAFPQKEGPNGVKILRNELREMAGRCLGIAQPASV
ncbi:hypothetical protein NK8_83780 (plasmid) [Caballeronia sp. NK8]|nr:hypothetical protein NK8_83780 [Caballeronia sp. NK8]